MERLIQTLHRIDGRQYGAYKDLRGTKAHLEEFELHFDHIQGDPFAAPSRIRLEIPSETVGLPEESFHNPDACRAAADFFQRSIRRALTGGNRGRGSGKSGLLEIASVGQEVLERTGVVVTDGGDLRVRMQVGLPAQGRRILGREAIRILTQSLPQLVQSHLREGAYSVDLLMAHVCAVEDQVRLRQGLKEKGLVAFVADVSLLPRKSGADDRPMGGGILFESPKSLRVEMDTVHSGQISGLGIPEGVTLIVGGGYHGKSTLLNTLARGVYDHLPGDGRERCVTKAETVTVRAEDGRSVAGVDLRPFIRYLPLEKSTENFSTEDASGSTSQAAGIVESIEAGAKVLLIDEDTAATNFMIRDHRMRELVPSEQEPIVPFIDRVRQLYEEKGISTVLVIGGAGDYLDVADTVIQMKEYEPLDVTEKARRVAKDLPLGEAAPQAPGSWMDGKPRVPHPSSLDPRKGKRSEKVRSTKTRSIQFGEEEIEVSLLAQLVDPSQCRMIGDCLLQFSRGLCDGHRSIPELLDRIEEEISRKGLESVAERGFGDRAAVRRYEIAAALNRLRTLRIL
ncbi:MAG: ABC-ATPase domain-containing protein [Candidatus Omnitrophica bacterium]|nr:ABC-ATPase domain-containing protein [Candidatus Omnitrophota bacterium]